MDRNQLIARLPPSLATALRLSEAQHDDSVVATALGIPVEGVSTVVRLAYAKLARLGEPGTEARWPGSAG
ncbi:MAG: hypothetical protein ACRDO8_06770 [Nocardioidaceae bacterium]